MSEDRFAEIKAHEYEHRYSDERVWWLIAEVDRLREFEGHQNEAIAQGMRMWVQAHAKNEALTAENKRLHGELRERHERITELLDALRLLGRTHV